jgi:hypothetical protein
MSKKTNDTNKAGFASGREAWWRSTTSMSGAQLVTSHHMTTRPVHSNAFAHITPCINSNVLREKAAHKHAERRQTARPATTPHQSMYGVRERPRTLETPFPHHIM